MDKKIVILRKNVAYLALYGCTVPNDQGRIQNFWEGGSYVYICGGYFTDFISFFLNIPWKWRERSGSVVECLTRDRRVAGSSLTGVTA